MATTLMGIQDVFSLADSKDVVVTGTVKGTIKEGAAVYLTNCGEDEGSHFLTVVKAIETAPSVSATEATDCRAGLRLENGSDFKIKKGTVLFSRDANMGDVFGMYTGTLGDVFVAQQQLEISDTDFEQLSIADCAEIWRLFLWYRKNVAKNDSEEAGVSDRNKINRIGAQLCKKILNADAIYCVFNRMTGEPHMFSQTVKQENGSYMCTPPQITIGTKAYAEAIVKKLSPQKYEIRRIENGEDKKGIYNFLGSTFYLNGACGVAVQSPQTSIAAEMLVPKPDYSNVPPQNIPVANPDLMRWMLLIGQLGKPEGKDAELIYRLYYKFMSMEIAKARFLIPMQHEGKLPEGDENGKVVLKKDVRIKFPTMKGKGERDAIRMYTDWKRLRMVYDNEWGGMVQPISGMIDTFDCAINATQFPAAGCYISKEMFEDMKKLNG
ncbi:MAG: hypothetical protein ACI4EQ_10015 [Lachnospiraceae bacterium]